MRRARRPMLLLACPARSGAVPATWHAPSPLPISRRPLRRESATVIRAATSLLVLAVLAVLALPASAKDTEDLAAITADPEKSPPSAQIGGEKVEPGSNGLFDLASASNDLPVPLLVALVALALVALIGGLVAMRERIPALSRIPLLSKIPRVPFPRFRR